MKKDLIFSPIIINKEELNQESYFISDSNTHGKALISCNIAPTVHPTYIIK